MIRINWPAYDAWIARLRADMDPADLLPATKPSQGEDSGTRSDVEPKGKASHDAPEQ